MMSVTVRDSDSWSLDYAVDAYNQTREIQGYILWRSKKELKHGQIEEFYTQVKTSKRSALRKINHFLAKIEMSNVAQVPHLESVTEMDAINIVLDKENPINKISVATYDDLDGDTPQEKLDFQEKVREKLDKEYVSRKDIREFKKGDKPLTEKEAIKQTNKEYDMDYFQLCGGGVGQSLDVFNIGFEIHKFDDRWASIKKILSKSAHPDKGGSADAMNFVSMLNDIFKDKKKTEKETKMKKDMTNRITELMGVPHV